MKTKIRTYSSSNEKIIAILQTKKKSEILSSKNFGTGYFRQDFDFLKLVFECL